MNFIAFASLISFAPVAFAAVVPQIPQAAPDTFSFAHITDNGHQKLFLDPTKAKAVRTENFVATDGSVHSVLAENFIYRSDGLPADAWKNVACNLDQKFLDEVIAKLGKENNTMIQDVEDVEE